MTYIEATYYNVACDECKVQYDHDEYSAFGEKRYADEVAEADDWVATQGRHLCPDCAELVVEDPPDGAS